MAVNWSKDFFNRLTIFQKAKFLITKLLRRVVSDIGQKKNFGSLYELYLLCKISGSSIYEEQGNYLVKHDGRSYFLRKNSSDIDVFIQVILKNQYTFIANFIKKNDIQIKTMIDAGANIGLTSLLFNYLFPGIKILAIEPDNDNFNILGKNIDNAISQSIEAIRGGLTPYTGWLTPAGSFSDNREWSRSFSVSKENISGICIRGYCVEELLTRSGWEQIDFLKIDIEGGEKDIFIPGSEFYMFLKVVKIIAIEIHDTGNLRQTIYSILKEFDFFLVEEGELTIGIKKGLV